MRVGAEEQVTYFMRDGKAEHHRRVGARLPGQPFHAIHENRRQLSLVRAGVYQGVSELKLSLGGRSCRQPDQSNGEFPSLERGVAGPAFAALRLRRGRLSTPQPCNVDAGGGQDPGRCTQSNRLIRRRHHPGVVHAHLNMLRKRRSVAAGGLYDT